MKTTVVLTFVIALGLIVGCSSNKGSNVAKNDPAVLDVAPTAPAGIPPAEPMIASAPMNDSPAVAFASNTPAPVTPVAMTSIAPASSVAKTSGTKSYKVKKGDTLFSIAKTQLGSGRDWQKIAAANPGLTPATLKAGQQIAMP